MENVLYLFYAAVVIQALYYVLVFSRINFVRPAKGVTDYLQPLTVVICAKNEAANLQRNLKIVLIQQYPQFEVIVVNDGSTDETLDVLVDYYKRNKNFRIVNIQPQDSRGKKAALQKGIEAATFDTIVVTDADCRPSTTLWLAKLAGSYMGRTAVVLGHSPFEKKSGWLNKLIRYENVQTAMQYFGFALAGLPYMGVGRNLSYKKNAAIEAGATVKGRKIIGGDDDLLVNAIANGNNTEVCIDKDAFMITAPKATFKDWLQQKKRHLRAGFYYKWYHSVLLFVYALSNLVFWLGLILLPIVVKPYWLVVLPALGLLLLRQLVAFRIFKTLGCADLRLAAPVLDVLYTVYTLLIFFLLLLQPKDKWK